MSEQTINTGEDGIGIRGKSFSPLTAAFCSIYIWLMVASVICAAAAVLIDSSDFGYAVDISAAALMIILTETIRYSGLKKRNLSPDMIKKNEKALDSRIMGSFGDIGGVGSIAGAVTGVAYAFIGLYVSDGGVFSSESFAAPLLNVLSRALFIAAVIAVITSKASISLSLYAIAGRTFDASGKELAKKACRVAHSDRTMKYLRNMAAVRLATVLSVSIFSVICTVSGAGLPYGCIPAAFIYVASVVLSDAAAVFCDKGFTEEKPVLWDKRHKVICAVNIVMLVIIGFFFVFSFPFQSVYSSYSSVSQYDYYEEVDNTIHVFSIPDMTDEAAAMPTGIFIITIFMMSAVSASALTEKDDLSGKAVPFGNFKGSLIAAAGGIIVAVLCAICSDTEFGLLRWLVTLSIACLIIMVNIISTVIINRKS